MDDVKNQGAAPSAAEQNTTQFASGKLTPDIQKQFLKVAQGKEDQPKPADTASADTSKETKPEGDKPESAADAGAAKESKQEKQRHKQTAEERIQQLEATIEKIRKESGKQAPAAKEADSATAKPEPVKALEPPKKPVRPKAADFDSYDKLEAAQAKYDEDLDKYWEDMRAYERQKTIEEFKISTAQEKAQQEFNQYLSEAEKRYPDLKEVLPPLAKELQTADVAVQVWLQRTDLLADILYVIAEKPQDRAAFIEEAKSNPFAAIERLVITKQLVKEQLSKSKPSEPEKKETKPPAEKKTDEPQPNREVGNRGTGPNDPAADAVRRNSFRDFDAAQRRKYAERT